MSSRIFPIVSTRRNRARHAITDALARILEAPLVWTDPLEPADAIVVLGTTLGPGGAITSILAERIAAAAQLWHAGAGRHVVASGGITDGAPRSEAAAIADGLAAAGVPISVVIVEDESRTTADNARLTAALLAPLGARTVWLVTQPFHGRRAAFLFRRAGLEPRVWHIAESIQYRQRARALRWIVREYAAWAKALVT